MENFDVLKDISRRTGGDIYLGVVGPVRTGQSTFIKRFMESLVLPNIEDIHERSRTVDELPQSGAGRTVMTAEPKFIPAEAVEIQVAEGVEMRVRLVDCVGYAVEGARGFDDEDGPRMVSTPWFEEPLDESAETVICRKSGYRASDACDETDTIRIPESGLQTKTCPFHRFIHLSLDEKFRVNSSCERIERMIKKSWFVLPPAQEYYYKNYHIDYRPLPPIKPGCDETQSSQIAIIYPEYNAILILPKGFEGEKNPVVFKAAHAREDATLYWHLDDIYLGETSGKHEIACRPDIGTHLLTVIDEQGNQRKIIFNVK